MRLLENMKLGREDLNLSTEMIDQQRNDAGVAACVASMETIHSVVAASRNDKSTAALAKNPIVSKAMLDMQETITKRLGVPVHIIAGDIQNAFCMPAIAMNDFALQPDNSELLDGIEQDLANSNKTEDQLADDADNTNKINGTEIDWMRLEARFNKNSKLMSKHLSVKNIIIDRGKAKMYNVPKDLLVTVCLDFTWFFNMLGLTPREAVAILWHELGHMWTFIEYLWRGVHNNTVLMDTLKENIKNGKSPKEAIKIAMEKIDPKVSSKVKDSKNVATIALSLGEVFMGDNKYSSVDSEQLADQFATRFGLGEDLASGLAKMTEKYGITPGSQLVITGMVTLSLILAIWVSIYFNFIYVFYLVGWISASQLALLSKIVFWAIVAGFFVKHVAGPMSFRELETYDDWYNRLRRIRMDVIRQLRSKNIDKKLKDLMIKSIENIDIQLKDDRHQPTYLTKAVNYIWNDILQWGYTERKDYEKMDKVLEGLMENDLYIIKTKLETFKK